MLVSSMLGAAVQVAVVLAVGAILYLFLGRRKGSFAQFVGFARAPVRAVLLGLAVGTAFTLILFAAPGFAAMAKGPGTVPGEALVNGFSHAAVAALVVTAIFKTALAEELLFRGIIGKRLISWLGFQTGNAIQAALFGSLHMLLALTPQATGPMVAAVVLLTGAVGWVNGWLNERRGAGSILPGWASHAAANLCSYLTIAYGIF